MDWLGLEEVGKFESDYLLNPSPRPASLFRSKMLYGPSQSRHVVYPCGLASEIYNTWKQTRVWGQPQGKGGGVGGGGQRGGKGVERDRFGQWVDGAVCTRRFIELYT